MQVLVTGGAGFIGSNLVRASLEAGDEVRVLDDLSTGRSENLDGLERDVEFVRGSVTEPGTVGRAVRDCEVIFHQAALASVPRSVADPVTTHRANVLGTLCLLDAARKAGVRRVVLASSSSVYGDTAVLPKQEEMVPSPRSPYALQKLTVERYCEQYLRLYGLDSIALRYFNVFGPRQDPESDYAAVIPLFIRAIGGSERPRVFGDGHQSRDFTFVDDVVRANRCAALAPPQAAGAILNIARGGRVTLLELIDAIAAAFGKQPPEPIFEAAREGDVRHSEAEVRRAESVLGWTAKISLEQGLRETVAHFMDQEPT
ncbi:MAG: NAD-dependent epimerase/dehydratase family protein [Myxococcales bacterium]|nr:NAD-dependent epimerase/dehydratase family protein [Myxococcales bacterium]